MNEFPWGQFFGLLFMTMGPIRAIAVFSRVGDSDDAPGVLVSQAKPPIFEIIEGKREMRREVRRSVRQRYIGRIVVGIVLGKVVRVRSVGRPRPGRATTCAGSDPTPAATRTTGITVPATETAGGNTVLSIFDPVRRAASAGRLPALACAALLLPAAALAQSAPLSAAESDPRVLGWMQGTPPPPDRRITVAAGDFFDFPKSRWTVCHIRELFPTVEVGRGLGAPVPLSYAPPDELARHREAIDALTFTPMGDDAPMIWQESLAANYTDGMLILHKGRVVYEWYSGCLNETGQHSAMSMTKSTVGILAEMLIAEGRLDETAPVTDYVPELAGSGFDGATVRQIMDMTTGIKFDENYDDPNADIWTYAAAGSPLPKPPSYAGPVGYLDYVQTVTPEGEHGAEFHYKTVNTDVLGWIVTRITGLSYQDTLSDMLWSRIGAEQSAYLTVDAVGTPFAGGGLSAGLRDLGRIGLLLLNEGVLNDARIFPAAVSESIAGGGDREAFKAAGYSTLEGGSYRSMFWVFHNANGAYAARGVHGQTIYVDPTAEMVLVRFASYPQPKNALIDPKSLPAYQAVADYLMGTR